MPRGSPILLSYFLIFQIGTGLIYSGTGRRLRDASPPPARLPPGPLSSGLLLECLFFLYLYLDYGIQNCNKWSDDPKVINVHLATHTHDDMGWLKTVDEYFWGCGSPPPIAWIYQYLVNILVKNPTVISLK